MHRRPTRTPTGTTIRRGDDTAQRWISASCTMQLADDTVERMRALMRKRGLDYDAFVAAETFAEAIDGAVLTAK